MRRKEAVLLIEINRKTRSETLATGKKHHALAQTPITVISSEFADTEIVEQ
ncbi:MAG: hypothetical protein F6J87_08545 [Spirulina sp. SIO3F2]|nr:hypothetical protein [Spirulina sp. SIO3F2]